MSAFSSLVVQDLLRGVLPTVQNGSTAQAVATAGGFGLPNSVPGLFAGNSPLLQNPIQQFNTQIQAIGSGSDDSVAALLGILLLMGNSRHAFPCPPPAYFSAPRYFPPQPYFSPPPSCPPQPGNYYYGPYAAPQPAPYAGSTASGVASAATVSDNAPVYIMGNFQYPLSTTASAQGKVDYSRTLTQEFKNHPELADINGKLDGAAQQANQTYGDKFHQSVIIDGNGHLVGVYKTADLVAANPNLTFKNGSNHIPKGQTIHLPDGQDRQVAFDAYDSPLVLDLNGSGQLTGQNKVRYDISGQGQARTINDIANGAGVLCLDNGSNGKTLFGNHTDLTRFGGKSSYSDGFAALQDLADIADKKGLFSAAEKADLEQNHKLDAGALAVMQKQFGLGIKVGSLNRGSQSLAQAGVSEIDLGFANTNRMVQNFDGRGNRLQTEQGATAVVNGQSRNYADVWFKR